MKRLITVALLGLCALFVGTTPAAAGDTHCVGAFTGVAENIVVPSGQLCSLAGATVFGNVLAEPDSTLEIGPGTNIGGNVEAKEMVSTFSFMARIGGSYKCDNCLLQDVVASEIGGSVEIKGADDGDFIGDDSDMMFGNTIGGNVEISESDAGIFAFGIGSNRIQGSVRFEKNRGPVVIERNVIAGELQIFENAVAGSCGVPEVCGGIDNGRFSDNQVGGNMQLYKNTGPIEVTRNVIRQSLQCFENIPDPTSAGNTAQKYEGQCLV